MPSYLLHLLQPLDVGCFLLMKKVYGGQAKILMCNQINHITKLKFLPCFKAAFDATITKNNILGGFQGAGLVLHDPEAVISKLDVCLHTLPLPTIKDSPWQLQIPSHTLEFGLQSKLIQEKIQKHVDSLPTSMVEAFEKIAKGAAVVAHKLVLLQKRIAELEAANEAATQHKSHKRKRVQKEGILTVEDGVRLTTLKEFNARSDGKKAKKRVCIKVGELSQRCCRCCSEAGHNLRTCKQETVIASE
jgi:hypothetical protein